MRFAPFLVIAFFCLSMSSVDAQDWVPLFDGRSLDGWKAGEHKDSATVQDGMIVCGGLRSHLFYVGDVENADFKNFELKADVMTKPGANSGIYFHTEYQEEGWPDKGYEIQVNNSHIGEGDYRELKKTGSLYGVRNVYKGLVNDNEWFTLYVRVAGKRISAKVNDILVVDYVEPDKPVRREQDTGTVLSSGTFALQCHDPHSKVFFKNILVRPLPDNLPPEPGEPPVTDELYAEILRLSASNFPVIDLHTHLKGGLTVEDVLEKSRRTGIFYGIAPNCGLGFPITNDEGIYAFLAEMKGQPFFLGMQAEGREWVNMFSKEAISKFDYVFTDSMTFRDENGNRVRLWMPDEVKIEDKQEFMDMYVQKTVSVLTDEPIDIYVNPTFLPQAIADEYDELWTRERMQKVIDAAVKNNVAIEINSRFRLPSEDFIKLAKKSGAKFSLGTNNGGKDDLGRLEYSLEMVKECGLTWEDMFVPSRD